MATLADITVKDYTDNDRTYVAIMGSSGDKTPAIWRHNDGAIPALFPEFRMQSRSNGNSDLRRLDFTFQWPTASTDVTSPSVTIATRMSAKASIAIPQNIPLVTIQNQVYHFCNLMAAALIKQASIDGYAPRS